MTDDAGLLYAYLLNGQGGGESLDWDKVKQWKSRTWRVMDASGIQ